MQTGANQSPGDRPLFVSSDPEGCRQRYDPCSGFNGGGGGEGSKMTVTFLYILEGFIATFWPTQSKHSNNVHPSLYLY